jgi:hypothetical protein
MSEDKSRTNREARTQPRRRREEEKSVEKKVWNKISIALDRRQDNSAAPFSYSVIIFRVPCFRV